jgi:Family of unknown function (DUF6435)
MFSFFKKDPLKELNKQYLQKLEEAMHAQRNGDIRTYSMLTSEAVEFLKQIEALENQQVNVKLKAIHSDQELASLYIRFLS